MTAPSVALDPAVAGRLEAGDPLAWTRALVAIPSVNPDIEAGGAGEAAAADFIGPYLERWGYQVVRHEPAPGRVTLVATLGNSATGLALCGHLDTVGVRGMTVAPFEPREVNGRLHGRGSADMKSGVAAILAAAHAAASEASSSGLSVILTADEEHASLGLRHLLDAGVRASGVVVAEPTSLAIAPANKGFAWVRIEARGRAAHGSRPDLGRDAIRQLARALGRLDVLDGGGRRGLELGPASTPPHPLLGHGSLHAGTIEGGDAPSVYPAGAHTVIEARLVPGQDAADFLARVEEFCREVEADEPGVTLQVKRGMIRPAADLTPEHDLVRALSRALEQEGATPRVEGMTAWVESSWFMDEGIPALCFGPGSIAQAHTADEWVDVGEIETAARVLTRMARSWVPGGVA
jgi:acetylornithine deacetylase